jgi:hypothetical protein
MSSMGISAVVPAYKLRELFVDKELSPLRGF